jgi:hypothetical protein
MTNNSPSCATHATHQPLWRAVWPALAVLTAALVPVVALYALSNLKGIPLSTLTRDPAAINNTEAYVGALSNLGIVLWSGAAAICLLCALILRGRPAMREAYGFYLSLGLFTLLLAMDDLYLLHEDVIPRFLRASQSLVYAAYMVIFSGLLLRFARHILGARYLLFGMALFFLALSVVSDILLPASELESFFEDSAKFLGICFWLAYCLDRAMIDLSPASPVS